MDQPTKTHYRRAESSCVGDTQQCQKPSITSNVTIICATVIPVVLVTLVVGFFVVKSYKRGKKEELEHDPDFDENGEATALPDLPQKFGYENPFDNRNSIRYPNMDGSRYNLPFSHQVNGSVVSLNNTIKAEPYVDSIVLPYSHQFGSKQSLDEYARTLGDFTNHSGYNAVNPGSRRGSFTRSRSPSIQGSQQRDLTETHLTANSHQGERMNANKTPSNLVFQRSPQQPVSPTKNQYATLPNQSNMSLSQYHNARSSVVHRDEDDDDSTTEGSSNNKFSVNYENDSSGRDESTKTDDELHEKFPSQYDARMSYVPNDDDNNFQFAEVEQSHQHQTQTYREEPSQLSEENYDANHLEIPKLRGQQRPASPDLETILKDESDDEDKVLAADEEEELKRMRSVYKVYFDRDNSIGSRNETPKRDQEEDARYPLPNLEEMRKNTEYNRTVAHENIPIPEPIHQQPYYQQEDEDAVNERNRRMTTASSFYSEFPGLDQQQKFNLQQYPEEQLPAHYGAPPPRARKQPPPPPLQPLQTLRSASDLRKSTIQTFTDFVPKFRPTNTSSPRLGNGPFNPLEHADQLWSPSSPSPDGVGFPTNNTGNKRDLTPPSASQMARSSVVMLNPVEIGKNRTFKPAGSLPTPRNPAISPQQQYSAQSFVSGQQSPSSYNHETEGLNGNRSKQDLRKMIGNDPSYTFN